VVVDKLDNKWKADFVLIKQGKYSKNSKEFQESIPKVIKIVKNGLHKDQVALQHKIFRKTDDLRQYWEDRLGIEFDDEMEVWDGFEIENETLNLTTIKQQELV